MRKPRPHRAVLLVLTAVFALTAAPVAGQYFPAAGDWASRTPAQVGMNAERLQAAVAFAIASESQATRDLALNHYMSWGREPMDEPIGPHKTRGDMTGMVIRNGYIVAEWGEPQRVDMTFSVTKTFLSTTIGLAWDDGLIADVHDLVWPYADEWLFEGNHNRKITWDHLLRQTSDWQGTLWDKPDWVDRPPRDMPLAQYKDRPRDEPGTVYKYNDTRVNVLALAGLYVWRRPLPEVLRERIMDPIGASRTWTWHGYQNSWVTIDGQRMQSVSGGGHWGGGMWLSAHDQARLGLLYLRNGNWDGHQLISQDWIRMARTPGDVNTQYGYMNWFLNTGQRSLPDVPETAVRFMGAGSNMVYVDWEHDLVVVARWIRGNRINDFLARVIAAIEE